MNDTSVERRDVLSTESQALTSQVPGTSNENTSEPMKKSTRGRPKKDAQKLAKTDDITNSRPQATDEL